VTENMLIDLLTFMGLMALLGTSAKVTLALINRRRGGHPAIEAQSLTEIAERLARLEQIAESTAVEVERIGEGQRFAAKLLAERPARQ